MYPDTKKKAPREKKNAVNEEKDSEMLKYAVKKKSRKKNKL